MKEVKYCKYCGNELDDKDGGDVCAGCIQKLKLKEMEIERD